MSTTTVSPVLAAKGGSFLIETRSPAEVFTPEDLNEEQRQMAATVAQFARDEILPAAADIDAKKPGVLAGLLRKAAELGFTSVDIPEEYGGMGMDKTTSTIITDHLSIQASFSTAFGAHIGIATLPLVWYGTEEQKKRYLPKLATAEWIGGVRAVGGNLRLRCNERPHPRNPLGRRHHLHPQRREDVDHQLRHRRAVYRVRQNRRREILGISDRARQRPA